MNTKRDFVHVIIVDDSPTASELLVTLLQGAEGVEVVGVASNGEDAVRLTKRLRPDVVVMDIRMPKMDGLEATRRIMREVPTPIVVVTASLTQEDVDLAFEALRAGALTAIRKPSLADPEACDRLVRTIWMMAEVAVVHHWGRQPITRPEEAPPDRLFPVPEEGQRFLEIVGIASSTGGPTALAKIFNLLPASFPLPILVVQHVTPGFAIGLAEWLNGKTALHVGIASHGERIWPGTVLLAPDDYHMQVNARGVVELYKESPYKGLRPSANYLFNSLARSHGSKALGIILTGMGDDGAEGLEALHEAGGLTIAQDEESCVVYGMPHEAIVRNAVDWELSLDQVASMLRRLALAGYLGKAPSNG